MKKYTILAISIFILSTFTFTNAAQPESTNENTNVKKEMRAVAREEKETTRAEYREEKQEAREASREERQERLAQLRAEREAKKAELKERVRVKLTDAVSNKFAAMNEWSVEKQLTMYNKLNERLDYLLNKDSGNTMNVIIFSILKEIVTEKLETLDTTDSDTNTGSTDTGSTDTGSIDTGSDEDSSTWSTDEDEDEEEDEDEDEDEDEEDDI